MTETYNGKIERILFQNTETAWSVIILNTEERTIRASGIMPGLRLGMNASLSGEMITNQYGECFQVKTFEEVRPSDVKGIENYLSSGLIKNIGPKLAHEIVRTFGEDTLNVLDNWPERLSEIHGVGKKRIQSIIESVKEQKEIRSIMIWLKRYDISNALSAKIYKTYGEQSIRMLEENPYRLSDEIGGVGFKTADAAARKIGIDLHSSFRIISGVRACLEDAACEGNTCMPEEEFINKVASDDYLSLPREEIIPVLSTSACPTVTCDGMVSLKKYHNAEKTIVKRLRSIQKETNGKLQIPDIDEIEKKNGITYSQGQKEAITAGLTAKVSIITGGPGTGKTTIINAIIGEYEDRDMMVLLCAPTGRAAKRMNEVTGREASTIHRLLGFAGNDFEYNEENPLSGDVLIVDEASMIDTMLFSNLVRAIPNHMRLVIVGDVDQLPSVGAGTVLRDLVDSGTVPTTHLTEIYRQAQGSDIIMNAHAVNEGRLPRTDNHEGTDCWFFACEDRDRLASLVIDIATNRVPKKFGIDTKNVQVLSPMRREYDPIGSTQLARRLQEKLNPYGETVGKKGETEFRVGDTVMQVKNDYDKGIFNGDTGVIVSKHDEQDEKKTLFTARFDNELIDMTRSDIANLELAYACTIHKSQGSEYPVVIIPVHESQFIMLKKNLLYTGITRAKKQCILVGTRRAIAIACQTEDTKKRYTLLKEKLLECA